LLGQEKIDTRVWFGVVGLIIGTAILVGAPSNYARMAHFTAPTLREIVQRMVLYLSGAYFNLGTEATGKFIWIGALVCMLLFFDRNADRSEIGAGIKRGLFWATVSFVSLLAMTPATNFISTRTTFFAVVFLYVGVAALMPRRILSVNNFAHDERADKSFSVRFGLSTVVLMILAGLVVVESMATLISNVSLAAEVANRDAIVKRALASAPTGDKSPILVPFLATQPAALTYMQNPEHDTDFITSLGGHVGREIRHDTSVNAPLPNSVSPMKAIKFRQ
jgi:hypothetical protein